MYALIRTIRRSTLALGLAALLAGAGMTARAQSAAYSVSGWDYPEATGDYTLGYTFTANANITVTALGEWVPAGSPENGVIQGTQHVGIFDNGGDLLFSTEFTQSNATLTSNTLGDGSQFRYVDITALPAATRTLSAGSSYTIGGSIGTNATGTNALDRNQASAVTITSAGLYNNGDTVGGASPTAPEANAGFSSYGINFEFTNAAVTSSTPEPGAMALVGGMLTCGACLSRRKRRTL